MLDAEQIIDFEAYQVKPQASRDGRGGGRLKQHFLAVLLINNLKIFRYVRQEGYYKYETKVHLDFVHQTRTGSGQPAISNYWPIFNGGIAVYNEVFVIQYKDKAEYLRIKYSERKSKETSEPAARVTLWDDTVSGRDSLLQVGHRPRAATIVEPTPLGDSDDENAGGAMAFGDDEDAAPVPKARAGSMAFNQAGVAAKG